LLVGKLTTKRVDIIKMGYLDDLKKQQNYKQTENLAKTHASTLDPVLDFYSLGGALRNRNKEDVISLFSKAFNDDPLLALKCLFYLRDVRGGQGERQTFRRCYEFLGNVYPEVALKNLEHIPFYGRWDDIYCLVDTPLEQKTLEFIGTQLFRDLHEEHPSLAGKWAKSVNTSSERSCELGRLTAKAMDLNEANYRKLLSTLRKKIGIVERKMCAQEWDKIEYESVPSNAMLLYRNAFKEHDPEGWEEYMNDVEEGTKTIHTATLYPYDILRKCVRENAPTREITTLWDNLPDYTEGREENSIVVCDTSGSMTGSYWSSGERVVEPILVAVSLAIYFGERAKGPFHNHFITFSANPTLQEIQGKNLYEKFYNLEDAYWDCNTDLQSVFKLLLSTAIANNTPEEEMIHKIYIISDMEFDQCTNPNQTNFEAIQNAYNHYGYNLPQLVFWNVDARQDQAPITVDDTGVFLVSGCSPSIFKNLMESKAMSARDLMVEVLEQERYDKITLP
jgi:hypothetical protein